MSEPAYHVLRIKDNPGEAELIEPALAVNALSDAGFDRDSLVLTSNRITAVSSLPRSRVGKTPGVPIDSMRLERRREIEDSVLNGMRLGENRTLQERWKPGSRA